MANTTTIELLETEKYKKLWEESKRDGYGTFILALADEIEHNLSLQTPCGGWVAVEDGLPMQGKRVLVATNTGSMEVGYYYKGYWERNWAGTTFGEAGYQITHWMKLPEPPK